MIKPENYITIQGWMVTELELKGNELLIYAIIYGFSQNEDDRFTGSLKYLADWTGATKKSVITYLKALVDKGYIQKEDIFKGGVKFCQYRAVRNPAAARYPARPNIQITQATLPPPDKQTDLQKVVDAYQNNIMPIRRAVYDAITKWLDVVAADLIIAAIQEAATQNAPSWAYIDAILTRCQNSGITDAAGFNASNRQFKSRKAKGAQQPTPEPSEDDWSFHANFGD